MIEWISYLPFALICHLLCWLTNPLVVLLADEWGELRGFWHYWQTWDDSLDSAYFMREVAPPWLDYGYDEHYTQHIDIDKWTAKYNKTRIFSVPKYGAEWTTKQKLQRYICRVLWLYRNCAYGFMMYWFGADMTGASYKVYEKDKFYCRNEKYFCYKNEQKICSWVSWKIYIGWKTYPGNENEQRCMYAYRCLLKVVL